jgi:Altered inheritance of mitochondria protein 21
LWHAAFRHCRNAVNRFQPSDVLSCLSSLPNGVPPLLCKTKGSQLSGLCRSILPLLLWHVSVFIDGGVLSLAHRLALLSQIVRSVADFHSLFAASTIIMSVPSIPPRPARSQQQQAPSLGDNTPQIPPRPARRMDRSASPSRHIDSFAPSPLNDGFGITPMSSHGAFYGTNKNESSSTLGVPNRPPSVNLPSVGNEGDEYANMVEQMSTPPVSAGGLRGQAENVGLVGSDVKLHAPKPTLPASTAKAKTAIVTNTDSNSAAAAGIGRPASRDDYNPQSRGLKERSSFTSHNSSTSNVSARPASMQFDDDEQGIPEIGMRVPMYPNAGDVQAPSPSPHQSIPGPGVGFHASSGSGGRHHGRTPSGREFKGPPGSYGLHGHSSSAVHAGRFEKAWYDKHPEALEREEKGEYAPGATGTRTEWALSSEDLNRAVRETAVRGSGFGEQLLRLISVFDS